MAVWSKLQKSLYLITCENIDFQIHCAVYRMNSARGSVDLPRYWITVGKKIIFDYPKQFLNDENNRNYPYETQISNISNCIREYIDCPLSLLLENKFECDLWGLTDILKASDKRLGKQKLQNYFSTTENFAIKEILKKRFG